MPLAMIGRLVKASPAERRTWHMPKGAKLGSLQRHHGHRHQSVEQYRHALRDRGRYTNILQTGNCALVLPLS
jgi:hypothetical protein